MDDKFTILQLKEELNIERQRLLQTQLIILQRELIEIKAEIANFE